MAFQTSPGINVSEVDLTNAVPAVGTTEGAIAGVFRWGPVGERVLVSSEQELVDRFGAPVKLYAAGYGSFWSNVETFYTAANFLGYSDALYVTRVGTTGLADATETDENFTAKYKGLLGNSISVSYCVNDTDADATEQVRFSSTALTNKGTIDIVDGSRTQATIEGASATSVAFLRKGTKVIIKGSGSEVLQKMTVKEDVTNIQGGVEGTAKAFEPDAVPSSATDSGVVLQSESADRDGDASGGESVVDLGTNGSIINLQTHGFTLGQAVKYNPNGNGTIGGLENGRVYYAIPVTASAGKGTDGAEFTTGGSVTGTTTDAVKLALTKQDALDHTDASPKNVQLTSRPTNTDTNSQLIPFTSLNVTVQFEERFTGIIADIDHNDYEVQWGDADLFDAQPSVGSIHIVVRDADGKVTGTAGSILEIFENVSTISTAKKSDGSSNWVYNVLEEESNWIKITEANSAEFTKVRSGNLLSGGNDGADENSATISNLAAGYDLYVDPADVDISFILQGKAKDSHVLANYIIDNVAEVRRDCVAFISPELADTTVTDVISFSNSVTKSSYAVVDSGYKYQYDKYNDVYTYIPLNGDIAGLCARTDDLRDPWFSPAGYQRGNVKNVVKLLVNPSKAERDLLYKNGVNPVITQPGQGTVLFGDKTFTGVTSAFDRINVRRLFIVLEKTISRAAKSTLFEFNDEFTRAQFVNLVEPFLRDVQGRRGIYDFKVVCDASNNTDNVVNNNQFVGDIYVKPARSINFIQLNFVAVRSGVEFKEIVGQA
jgi:hypothetical protein